MGGPADTHELVEDVVYWEAKEEMGSDTVGRCHSPLTFNSHFHLGPEAYMADTPPERSIELPDGVKVEDDVVETTTSLVN